MYFATPENLQSYAGQIAKHHSKVLLYGELGAGKTTFTKGFVSSLGIDALQVTSPTYTYQNIYDHRILHIDMYRFDRPEKLHETGILEQIELYEYIIIERPKWENLYADETWLCMRIEKTDDGGRNMQTEKFKFNA